eukprot:7409470-Karenia_brevis.AAC.1
MLRSRLSITGHTHSNTTFKCAMLKDALVLRQGLWSTRAVCRKPKLDLTHKVASSSVSSGVGHWT